MFGVGEGSPFLDNTGDFFGDLSIFTNPGSFSGDGDEPGPLPEFWRDEDGLTFVSKCRNL